jgi:hypothetical protein
LIKGKLTVQSQYLTVIQPFPERNRFPAGVWLINKTRAHHDNFQTNLHIHINRAAIINKILLQLKKNQNNINALAPSEHQQQRLSTLMVLLPVLPTTLALPVLVPLLLTTLALHDLGGL